MADHQAGYRRATRAEAEQAGYTAKSRAMVGPRGGVMSRRQYENIRTVLNTGYPSWSAWQREREQPSYQRFLARYADATDNTRAQGRSINSEFNRSYAAWRYSSPGAKKNPTGPFAKFLVLVGLRDEDATYDVGDTPPA